jgi:membrane protease YdiL (CAAX protease family)
MVAANCCHVGRPSPEGTLTLRPGHERRLRRRTVSRMRTTERASEPPAPEPARAEAAGFPRPAPRRTLIEEVVLVLSLSLLAAAVYSILDFTAAPVNVHVTATVISTSPRLATQLVNVAFALPPAWLALYLVRRNGETLRSIGLAWDEPGKDVLRGLVLAGIVGAVGIGVYVTAVRLGYNRFVVPVPPLGQWWTVPVLLLNAAQNALVEEVVGIGFLLTRLRQIGVGAAASVGATALLRGTYHLYQGWGGFAGNVALGLFFGWIFTRWRRTWPLVIAHTLVDVGAGVLYIAFHSKLPGLLGA